MSDTEYNEEQIRRIAREEARDVAGIGVEGPDGEEWSLSKLMENFEISRRTALQAMGLIALGYHAPKAVLEVFAQDGEAASQDNLTVPGTLDAGAIDTGEGTIDGGKEIPGVPPSSSDPGLSVDTWRQPSTERPVSVTVTVFTETDGTNPASLKFEADEGGGTSADYSLFIVDLPPETGAGANTHGTITMGLPPGAQYRVVNFQDPNNEAGIVSLREMIQ